MARAETPDERSNNPGLTPAGRYELAAALLGFTLLVGACTREVVKEVPVEKVVEKRVELTESAGDIKIGEGDHFNSGRYVYSGQTSTK